MDEITISVTLSEDDLKSLKALKSQCTSGIIEHIIELAKDKSNAKS